MSFAKTVQQVRNRTKDVTRRIGWANLRPGELVQPIIKGQGLRKGERVELIGGPIVSREVSRVVLGDISDDEIAREGFPGLSVEGFVELFGAPPETVVTRIAYAYVEDLAPRFDRLRRSRGVSIWAGCNVRVDGSSGVVVGINDGGNVEVYFRDMGIIVPCHPTWRFDVET